MQRKTCVVTGSSKGISRATAERFGEEECEVVVDYWSSADTTAETVERIEATGTRCVVGTVAVVTTRASI